MRRPLESAVVRRDDQLIRTRRLSAWLAGGATATSLGLAGVLGLAIPGHAAPLRGHPAAVKPAPRTTGSHGHARRHRITPPSAPPSSSSAPPVVSSGGS